MYIKFEVHSPAFKMSTRKQGNAKKYFLTWVGRNLEHWPDTVNCDNNNNDNDQHCSNNLNYDPHQWETFCNKDNITSHREGSSRNLVHRCSSFHSLCRGDDRNTWSSKLGIRTLLRNEWQALIKTPNKRRSWAWIKHKTSPSCSGFSWPGKGVGLVGLGVLVWLGVDGLGVGVSVGDPVESEIPYVCKWGNTLALTRTSLAKSNLMGEILSGQSSNAELPKTNKTMCLIVGIPGASIISPQVGLVVQFPSFWHVMVSPPPPWRQL